MTKRIDFCVVKITGEDENFPASELNEHKPTIKGWQSPRFCPYPQVIVLHLEARTRICRIQLLSHRYLTSKKVELFVGDVPKGMLEVPQNVTWEKLGEIGFVDNFDTKYQAREMRSAILDVVAKFVKLVLHQNHVNRLNLCNQVGLVGINVIGEVVLEGGSKKDKYMTDEDILNWRTQNICPMDDLGFCMYVDPEIQHLLRILYARKQKAVAADRFVYAKKLKYAISELRKVGEKIGKYDIEKQQAIENEDYDKAHVKKEQIESFRLREYERLQIPELMEMDGYNPDEDQQEKIKAKRISTPPPRKTPPDEAIVPMLSNYVNHDDSVLPALKKGGKSQPSVFGREDAPVGGGGTLMKLSEKERREASLPIDVFGLPLVEKMYSKSYTHREEAMSEVQSFLEKYQKKGKSHSPSDVVKATNFLVQRALKDQVQSVYASALEVLKYCFGSFIPTQKVPKIESTFLAEKTTPEILAKLGDTAPRVKKISADYFMDIASYPEVESLQIIPTYCLEPVVNNLNFRLAQARCELLESLVKKYPPRRYKLLPVSKTMPFLVNTLQHPSASVRGIAERIIMYLYEHENQPVREYLPSDSEVSKRNILYRRIFEELWRIDMRKHPTKWDAFHNSALVTNGLQRFYKLRSQKRRLAENKGAVPSRNNVNKVANKPEKPKVKTENFFENENWEIDLDKTCIFCGEQNSSFTPEGLEMHYSRDCPMLYHCSNCKQVVEIAGLTEHLLEECEFRSHYKQCPLCLEAIPLLNFKEHVKIRNCVMAKSVDESNHCPLCHNNIPPGEVGWRNHLMVVPGCPFNPRQKEVQKAWKKNILGKKGDRRTLLNKNTSY